MELHYIGVESAEITKKKSLQTCKTRWTWHSGKDIERRSVDIFRNLKLILPDCDLAAFYDNTTEFRRFAIYTNRKCIRLSHSIPKWFEKFTAL